jgi:hypothetical protein
MTDAATRILAAAGPGEIRVLALDADDAPLDAAVWRPDHGMTGEGLTFAHDVGALHRGRLAARRPVLAGAFVALDGADGFLPDSAGGAHVPEGTMLGVRIVRAAQGGKGPRLTARLEPDEQALVGAGPPALLVPGPNAVERLAILHPGAEIIVDDPLLAAALRRTLAGRVRTTARAFDDAAEAAFAALTEPRAVLPGGATMHIHSTPALTAIDIDLAAASTGRGGKKATHLAANRGLLPAIARQIRLRNLGGGLVVDVAGLSAKQRGGLAEAFAQALRGDPAEPRFLGFTALGFAEILRPRIHAPLHEMLAGPTAAAPAALRALLRESLARPAATLRLRAAPALAAAVQTATYATADLARRTGRTLMLETDRSLPGLDWIVEEAAYRGDSRP